MSDPTRLHKPYTTGARPSTTTAKGNVHMTTGGWVRTITATDYAWAGNNNVDADPEVLVAGSDWTGHTGWYAYTYWATSEPSEGTPIAISVHVHFNERVTITGTPTITITNTKEGGGSATTLTASFASLHNSYHYAVFTTGVPSANQLKEDDILYINTDPIALPGGATIRDRGTTTNTIITAAADVGYRGSDNRGGNRNVAGVLASDGPRLVVVA